MTPNSESQLLKSELARLKQDQEEIKRLKVEKAKIQAAELQKQKEDLQKLKAQNLELQKLSKEIALEKKKLTNTNCKYFFGGIGVDAVGDRFAQVEHVHDGYPAKKACLCALKQNLYSYHYVKIVDNPDWESTLKNLTNKQSLKGKIKNL